MGAMTDAPVAAAGAAARGRLPTRHRAERVSLLLAWADRPLTAREIAQRVMGGTEPWQMWPAWEVLDDFEERGLVGVLRWHGERAYCRRAMYAALDALGKIGPEPRAAETLTELRLAGDLPD